MKKTRPGRDFIAYAVGIALLCMVTISVLTWQGKNLFQGETRPQIAYVHFGPLVVEAHGHAYRASISVQANRNDSQWMTRNATIVGNIMQQTFASVAPASLQSAKGLESMQGLLKNNINAALDAPRVQEVWITDFIWQKNED